MWVKLGNHVYACVSVDECVCGRPHEQFTQPVSLSSPPNSKLPKLHLIAKYLVLYLNR